MLTVAVRRCCAGVAARATTSAIPSRAPALAARRPGLGPGTGTPRGWNCRTFAATGPEALGMQKVLFVEVGMGADQHGQDATKAAVRACRNAIEFNSIPSIRDIVPGGYDNMKLHIQLGVPEGSDVDLGKVRAVFPYGNIVEPVDVCVGGLMAKSGIAIPEMGDKNDDFVIAVASITVGY